MINYVYLENIRSYESKKVEFGEGITLLWGDIGSGKSTLLQSIEFALFGAGTEITPKSLLRAHKRRGVVKVGLEINGNKVIIERILEKKHNKIENKENYISINGLRERVPPTVLKYKVFKLLGYPLNILGKKEKFLPYRYTVYTPQEQMKEILLTSSNERLNLLRSIFDVDKYQRIIENAKKVREQLKKEVAEMEGELKDVEMTKKELEKNIFSLNDINEELETLKQEKNKAWNTLKEYESKFQKSIILEKEIALLKKDVESIKERLEYTKKKYEEQQLRVNDLLKELEKIFGKSDVNALEEEIKNKKANVIALLNQKKELLGKIERKIKEGEASIKKAQDDEKKLKAKEERVKLLNDQLKKEKDFISNSVIKIQELEHKIEVLLSELKEKSELEIKIKEKTNLIEELKRKIASIESEVRIKKKSYESIKSLKICPVCKQKVTENHKQYVAHEVTDFIRTREKDIENIHKELKIVENDLKELQNKKEELDSKNMTLELMKKEYTRMKKEIESKEREINRLEEELYHLKKDINEISISLYDVKRMENEVKEARIKKDELFGIISKLQQELKEIENYEDKISFLRKEYKRMELIEKELKAAEEKNRETSKKEIILRGKIIEYTELKDYKKRYESQKKVYENIYGKVRELEGMREEIKKRIETIREILGYKEKVGRKKEKYEKVIAFIENEFIPLIDIIEKRILSEINMKFNAYFVEWFEQLLEHTELSASIDETFTPHIEQEGGYSIDYEHLSGGEKTSVALAYRLALNKIMNQLIDTLNTNDLLILDEPTDGFSSEQIQNMREILEKLNLKQIILVSHEEMVKDIADNIIKLKKINGTTHII